MIKPDNEHTWRDTIFKSINLMVFLNFQADVTHADFKVFIQYILKPYLLINGVGVIA